MPPATSPENELRKHFPAVYLTLISILVALAVEGLLGRVSELPSLFVLSPATVLHWLQISLVLLVAALFWWVIVRWATTLPWGFGFFDALAPLVLLVFLHFFAHSVAGSADRWFGAIGLVSIGGAVNYSYSARRALALVSQAESQRSILLPAGIVGVVGLLSVVVATVGLGEISVILQIFLNTLVLAVIFAFGFSEYRFWRRAVSKHLASSSAP